MKILVTGFEPFGGEQINPAWLAVQMLPDSIAGARLIKVQVPTEFDKAGQILEETILQEQPDMVICVGQAGGRSVISMEKVAINYRDAAIPDNAGYQPADQSIKEDGETAYFTSLPVKAMVQAVRQAGIPAGVSFSAGTYVCNDLMYTLLYLIDRKYPSIQGGFIHVPYATAQAVGKPAGTPAMSLQDITTGLQAAILAAVSSQQDISAPMGTVH